MNKNKFLTFLLFGLILVILIELGIIFIGNSSSIQISSPSTIRPAQTANLNNPTSSLQSPTSNNASQSSASNLPYIPLISRLDYIEGKVISWEDIPNSSDKYLILNEEKTNKTIKARIIFDKEAVTSPTKFATGFGKRKTKNLEFEILGPIANYEFTKIKNLVDASKMTLIIPIYENPKDTTFEKDERGQMIVRWLIYLE